MCLYRRTSTIGLGLLEIHMLGALVPSTKNVYRESWHVQMHPMLSIVANFPPITTLPSPRCKHSFSFITVHGHNETHVPDFIWVAPHIFALYICECCTWFRYPAYHAGYLNQVRHLQMYKANISWAYMHTSITLMTGLTYNPAVHNWVS